MGLYMGCMGLDMGYMGYIYICTVYVCMHIHIYIYIHQ